MGGRERESDGRREGGRAAVNVTSVTYVVGPPGLLLLFLRWLHRHQCEEAPSSAVPTDTARAFRTSGSRRRR